MMTGVLSLTDWLKVRTHAVQYMHTALHTYMQKQLPMAVCAHGVCLEGCLDASCVCVRKRALHSVPMHF